MSSYVLVENRTTVLLGPISWRQRFIQSELDDLEVSFYVPPVEQGYIKINDSLELFPIISNVTPSYDPIYEQLVGPLYTYTDFDASYSYTIQDLPIANIQTNLKNIVAGKRYVLELSGTTATVQGINVTVDTSRDSRNIFVQKYLLMGDTDTTQWKFPEGWLTLTKQELGGVVATGAAYVQAQFDWECTLVAQIDAAQTKLDLQTIAESFKDKSQTTFPGV